MEKLRNQPRVNLVKENSVKSLQLKRINCARVEKVEVSRDWDWSPFTKSMETTQSPST